MSPRALLYALVGAAGLAAAVAVPLLVGRGGSEAVPAWAAAAAPGPLSAAHAVLGARCESCHAPFRGVEAGPCLACHAGAAPGLLTKASTAFHATVGECAGCHVEHLGRDRRPVGMDHAVLVRAGHAAAAAGDEGRAGFRHALARLAALLGEGWGDLADGGGPAAAGRRALPAAGRAALDCAGCHAARDPHRTLFGRDCAGCHGTDAWTVAGFVHPSPRSPDCAQCHRAPPSHYMMHFEMMDRAIAGRPRARVEQCFLCHQTDSFNNIKGVGWRDMH